MSLHLSFPYSDRCQQKWPPAVALYPQPVLVTRVVARRHLVEESIGHKMGINCDFFNARDLVMWKSLQDYEGTCNKIGLDCSGASSVSAP